MNRTVPVLVVLLLASLTGCEYWDDLTLQDDDDVVGAVEDVEVAVREEGAATRSEINQEGADIEAAIHSARSLPTTPPTAPQPAPPIVGTPGGDCPSGGFLWKPISAGDGNLVILTPSHDSSTAVMVNGELGTYVGRTNGERPTHRFSMPGCGYGLNPLIESDTGITCTVPNGCNRYEK